MKRLYEREKKRERGKERERVIVRKINRIELFFYSHIFIQIYIIL